MIRKRKLLALLFLGIFILQFVFLPEHFNIQQVSSKNDLDTNQSVEIPYSQNLPPYDNQTHRYIFLFNSSINLIDNATMFDSFTNNTLKGVLCSEPWDYMYGFSGIINNSEANLGAFIEQYNPLVFQDNIIEGQMNSVHEQINTYPAVIDNSGYGYLGDLNSTLAFLDTGIDESHTLINQSNIITWEDYVNGSPTPDDINGHGTAISSISLGGGDTLLEPTH
ncbi:MAG: hypothetical protein ACTSPA_12065, partial [Promethearchaeota archaeon]